MARPGPREVDALIVHPFDPATPRPGGIDTCIRGLCAYTPDDLELAVVGVAAGRDDAHRVGRWERHLSRTGRPYWFLPVVAMELTMHRRRVPHSLRLMLALARHRGKLPSVRMLQAHRMDVAFAASRLVRAPLAYFVHTQAAGLVGATSDSFWRFAGRLHGGLERHVAATAAYVIVFNPEHARDLLDINPRTSFLPTWFDPALLVESAERDPFRIVWVGRMETPKDPLLAVRAFASLAADDPRWRFDLLGDGSLLAQTREAVAALPPDVAVRVRVHGRVEPTDVYRTLAEGGVFLMTSHPGYEGFPMVLVEAMASGLPAVVTDGSDTGGLVVPGSTGYVTDRDPAAIATALQDAVALDREVVIESVRELSAPELVSRAFRDNPRRARASSPPARA